MALPTLERTWQYNVNQAIPSSGEAVIDLKKILLEIKNSLIGFANSPWTVVLSCDRDAVATGSDLWVATTAMIQANPGTAHSWIVLQQAGVTGGPFQLCIDLTADYYGGMETITLVISPSTGFTGGTVTDRPTATDEAVILGDASWIRDLGATSKVLHVMMDSSGMSTRVFAFTSGTCVLHFMLETLADSALTYKGNFLWGSPSGDQRTASFCYNNAAFVGRYEGITYNSYLATEAFGSTPIVNGNSGSLSTFTSTFPITPVSSYSLTGGCRGRAGRFVDLYMGSSGVPTGGTYPLTPNDKEFAQFLQFIVPWNGSVVVMT